MVWPFFKRARKLELPPAKEERWGVAEGEYEGAALIVRYNIAAGEWAGQSELPIKLGFAIPFNRPKAPDLPDAEENADLGEIEDLIEREVFSATRGVFALVLTTGVMKEFVFYIAPGADIAALHARIRNQVSTHEVQCMAVEERKWESYRAFAP